MKIFHCSRCQGLIRQKGESCGTVESVSVLLTIPGITPEQTRGPQSLGFWPSSTLQTDRRNHGVYIYPIVHSLLWRSALVLHGSDED